MDESELLDGYYWALSSPPEWEIWERRDGVWWCAGVETNYGGYLGCVIDRQRIERIEPSR